ncbi:cytochrome P450 [Diplogelasinospora grovesii]|uniref:Cytochrome P450 n=1 Tax=Diplogelasinospora grovesii TaxID=303347 RepID=A0AAN6N2V3_9PEZI|nr:cytochrome P450 [Diplogelasinospora grovesii]
MYGPFVRIAHDEVSVCHPNAVKSLLVAPLHKGDWYKIFVLPDYRTKAPLGFSTPKDKLQLNKYFRPGYELNSIIRTEPDIDEVLTKLFAWMDKASQDHTPMKMGDFFSYAAYDITGEVTFSRSFGFTDKGEDIGGAIATNEAMELFFSILGYFRWFSYLICNPVTTWLEILPLGYMGATSKSALKERRTNPDARFDIAAHWFRALEGAGPGNAYWNDAAILAAAISNLGAGSDTVSCALQSFVYHLLRHPTGWQTIRDEIDAARAKGQCRDPIVTYEDATKLPYLQAALKEALRIFAPVPMGLPRVVPKGGVKFDDVFFPEGTVLSINPYVLQTSKALWGPDAAEFKPERWLGLDAAKLDKYFCPWGGGWASCPGQHLARIQMSKIAATLVRDYDLMQVNPKEEWEWQAYFTIVPKGWPVYVSKLKTPPLT